MDTRSTPGNRPMADKMRIVRVHGSSRTSDAVAVESPLQLAVDEAPFAVIMRTPGEDAALAAGFLLSEGAIADLQDIASIEQRPAPNGRDVVAIALAPWVPSPGSAERRRVGVNAACGMCGRVRVESIEIDRPPLDVRWQVHASMVASLPGRLRAEQRVFDETGGLHAAALFAIDGTLLASAEDVGRHNAVDKVMGRLLLDGRLPAHEALLIVSGRTAYEIVQKAFLAGVPFVAAVSAPSSLAVDLAHEAGITLTGFVRGEHFNVYTHPERISFAGATRGGDP
jgi:FdhD protein